jgi:hypothetical protein
MTVCKVMAVVFESMGKFKFALARKIYSLCCLYRPIASNFIASKCLSYSLSGVSARTGLIVE